MNRSVQPLFSMMILLLFMSAITTTAYSVSEGDRHVILVSVDVLAAYHLENENLELPNFRELIRDGAWPIASQSIFPSVTHPSHASLITGVTPRKHGVIGNRMTNRETGETFHPTTKSRSDVVHAKTLFDAAHEAGLVYAGMIWSGRDIAQGIRTGMVYNIDVAPTIARLPGLELPDVEGRILLELLDN